MRTVVSVVVLVLASVLSLTQSSEVVLAQSAPAGPSIAVHFSPKGGCTQAVVTEINAAKVSIDIQAYSFTSTPIASAVKKAFERGVKVRVILDKSQRTEKYSSATYLNNAHVPLWIDAKHAIAHNKIILIDGQTVLTGSFNFTKQAEENNAENLLLIRNDPELFAAYEANFEEHLGHSEKYTHKEG